MTLKYRFEKNDLDSPYFRKARAPDKAVPRAREVPDESREYMHQWRKAGARGPYKGRVAADDAAALADDATAPPKAKPYRRPRTGGRTPTSVCKRDIAKAAGLLTKDGKPTDPTKATPLEHMLSVMRDETQNPARRDRMAREAAPYMHAKLVAVEHTGESQLTVKIMRFTGGGESAAEVAFVGHEPPPLIEGKAEAIDVESDHLANVEIDAEDPDDEADPRPAAAE